MVVAMRRNETMRRTWEDEFVGQLQQRGIRAVPSYRLYPDRAPDTSEVADAALFLLGPAGRGITGEVLMVDAGYHVMGM